MATATIIENVGAGKYRARINADISGFTEKVDALTEEISKLTNSEIPGAQARIEEATIRYEAARDELNVLLEELKDIIENDPGQINSKNEEIRTVTNAMVSAESDLLKANADLNILNLKLLAARKNLDEQKKLRDAYTSDVRDVWAVDYTPDVPAGNIVGIAGINGETGRINIAAGGHNTDGVVTPRFSLNESEAYVSAALFPGWQKWRPTYRTGIISSIDHVKNICDISLDPANSTTDNLDINQSTAMTGVPIDYMECDSQVFKDDDHVVIQYEDQDWLKPSVIGFVTDPVSCGVEIQIRLLSTFTEPGFISMIDDRIQQNNLYINHLNFLKDDFLPQYYSHVRELTSAIKTYVFGSPVFWTSEEIETQYVEPWEDWEINYYPSFLADISISNSRLNNVKTIATYFEENMFGTISGTRDPEDSTVETPILDYVITLGCCPTQETQPEVINTEGLSQYLIAREKDKWGNTLLAESKDECSPQTAVRVFAKIGSTEFYSLSASLKAAYNMDAPSGDVTEALLHIIATDLDGVAAGTPGGWVDGMKWIFDLDPGENKPIENILEYPTENKNIVATVRMPRVNEEITMDLAFSMEGNAIIIPELFGGSIDSWTYTESVITGGNSITFDDEYSFCQLMIMFDEGIFNNSLTFFSNGAAIPGIQEQ